MIKTSLFSTPIQEHGLAERIKKAQHYAEHIALGMGIENMQDFANSVRARLAMVLGIGFFDKYFDDLTVDEMIFEIHLREAMTNTEVIKKKQVLETIKDDFFTEEELEGSEAV